MYFLHLLVEKDKDGLAVVHVGIPQNVKHLVFRLLCALKVGRIQPEYQGVGVGVEVAPNKAVVGCFGLQYPCGAKPKSRATG